MSSERARGFIRTGNEGNMPEFARGSGRVSSSVLGIDSVRQYEVARGVERTEC